MSKGLKATHSGWVVVNIGHPRTGNSYVVDATFRRKRTDAIEEFIRRSGHTWEYWKRKYNFRAVKAKSVIETV